MTFGGGRLKIGDKAFTAPVALAPMSGVTDLPFRRLAHRLGAPIVVSEMIASEELVKNRADVVRRAEGRELTPFIIQLAGREAEWMAEGARIAERKGRATNTPEKHLAAKSAVLSSWAHIGTVQAWAVSSAVERSPYTRLVGGSNPSPPTKAVHFRVLHLRVS